MTPVLAAVFALLAAPAAGYAQTSLDRFNGFEGGGPGDYRVAAGAPSVSSTVRRTGQFALSTDAAAGANSAVNVELSGATAVLIDRIWACVATAPAADARRIRSWRSGAEVIMELVLSFLSQSPRVQLRLRNSPISNPVISTCPTFSEIEVEYRADGSGGLAALRVDGSGGSVSHSVTNMIDSTVIGPDDGANSSVDVVWDDHGIVLGTTFPADLRVEGMPPTSFVSPSPSFDQWSAFGCTEKADCVREQPADGSQSLLFSDTVNDKQSICLEAAGAHAVFGNILSVKNLVVARGIPPLPTIGLFLRLNAPECGGESGLTSDDFNSVPLGSEFAGAARYDATSPSGGAWTEAQLNPAGLLIGFVSGTGQAQVTQVLREVAFDPAGSPSPTPTRTPTPTHTRTPTRTRTRTPTPTLTASATASVTPTVTPSEPPSVTPSHTATATDTPVSTGTPTPSASATLTPTESGTATVTETALPQPTPSGTPIDTPAQSPTPTTVMSVSPSASPTETPVDFVTPTDTPIGTATETATATPTPTGPTPTPTATFPRRVDYILTAGDITGDEFICTQGVADSLALSSAGSFDLDTLVSGDPLVLQRQYLAVYVVPDLNGVDYTNLARLSEPGGFIDQFVALGGVAILNLHGQASATDVAPRSVGYTRRAFGTNQETVQDATHPYITGEGYAGDTLTSSFLTGWNPTDQGFLTGLPGDATVLLRDPDGQPTWAEYNHGNGRVIVTTLTYCTPGERATGSKALENLLKYGIFFDGLAQTPGLTVTPTSTPTPTATGPTRTPTPTRTPPPTRTPTPTEGPPRGDVDDNGRVDAADLEALLHALFDPDPPAAADVNEDGRVSAADVTELIGLIVPP